MTEGDDGSLFLEPIEMSHCQGHGSIACAQRCEMLKTEQKEKEVKLGRQAR